MQEYMIYLRWTNKTKLPTAYNMSAKDLNNLRRNIIEKRILDDEKIDEIAVFKVSGKNKKQTHVGDMVKRQFIHSWVIRDKNGVYKWKDLNRDGTIRRN